MIALMILTLIGSLTAVQIKKMLDNHYFETEASALFTCLQESQALSAAYQTDLALDIYFEKGVLTYRISTDEPFPAKTLSQKPISLPHAQSIKFKDAKVAKLHFDIYSGGRVEPRGILTLYQTDEKSLWFDLQRGYLMKFSHFEPPPIKEMNLSRPLPESKSESF